MGGLAWIKPSKKDMAVTFSYSLATIGMKKTVRHLNVTGFADELQHTATEPKVCQPSPR